MSSNDAVQAAPIFVPDALKFYVNRLSFSKNRVRLQSLSTNTARANSQVIVRLPSNTMVNLASLTMTGSVRAYIDGTTDANSTQGVALPTNWEYSFIETLSLIANGGIITQPFVNYKLLGNILNDIYGNDNNDVKRSALQGSLPQPIQTRGSEKTPANQGGWLPFSINNWMSATQTMAPSYMSTNLLGDLELRLTMTDDSLVASGDTGDGGVDPGLQSLAKWEMKHINFYIETASIQSNILDQAVAAKLAAGEPINVPFENVFSFSQTNPSGTFNQRFSVSSQSVNKIIATCQATSDLNADRKKFENGIPTALRRNFCNAKHAQFSINNQYSPNYLIDSQLVDGYDPIDNLNSKNYQMSNALVETRAAMDIPDYDLDCTDKLCSTTQMPMEFFGAGDYYDTSDQQWKKLQPGTDQLYSAVEGNDLLLTELGFAAAVTGGVLVEVVVSDANTTLNEWKATGYPDEATEKPAVGTFYIANDAAASDTGASEVQVVFTNQTKKSSSYWFPYFHKPPIETYLEDKYVIATSFDLDVSDKDRLVSGINTLGSNAQMFLNHIHTGSDVANQSTVFVLCTSMVQIYAGATLKIIQ